MRRGIPAIVLISAAAAALGAGSAFAQTSVSGRQADQIALQAIPGAVLVHTSADHANGTPVWDIHVSLNNQIWDVKVDALTGSVLSKRLSSESASSSATGGAGGSVDSSQGQTGGSVDSSPDRAGGSVDSSPDRAGGSVDSSPDRAESGAAKGEGEGRQSFPAGLPSSGGVVFGQKTTAVPSQYQGYVNEALAKTGGTLKWVKFSREDSSNVQMNIKIRKASGGTVKVEDVFSAQGNLMSQKISGDS